MTLDEYCSASLKEIEDAGLLRKLRICENQDSRMVRIENRDYINFASNDYLGLSSHPKLLKAFEIIMPQAGATASRLIVGNHPAYEVLEQTLAHFKKTESALVFSSGYAAALGTIPALVGKDDFIVMDKLCHACLVDGARLSGATLRVFPHNNLKRCEELLATCQAKTGKNAKILLITESIFSMDGDLAPLDDLVELKKKYGAWLMVDEAHATGVLGKNGRGGAEHFGIEGELDVSMGTLSKALGCVGGFICGSAKLKEFLINRARSLIFSTGIPPGICSAAIQAIQLVQKQPELREKLWSNIRFLGEKLKRDLTSPIVPIVIGDEKRCMEAAEKMKKQGILVPAVRYPTVGRGKAQLRISLNAAHAEEDILKLVAWAKEF